MDKDNTDGWFCRDLPHAAMLIEHQACGMEVILPTPLDSKGYYLPWNHVCCYCGDSISYPEGASW